MAPSGRRKRRMRLFTNIAVGAVVVGGFVFWQIDSHRFWRTLELAISAHGTTMWALVVGVIAGLYPLIKIWWKGGIPAMKRHWKKEFATTFRVISAFWVVTFIYHAIWPPPESLSLAQMETLLRETVLEVSMNDQTHSPIGVGVWIDPRGYAFTVGLPADQKVDSIPARYLAGTIMPMLDGKMIQVASGVVRRQANVYHYDSDTGVSIMLVFNNPFVFGDDFGVVAESGDSKIRESSIARSLIPTISPNQVDVGTKLFVGTINRQEIVDVSMAIQEGTVTRLGFDTNKNIQKKAKRIYTSIPFQKKFVGAPALNEQGQLVGIVSATSRDITELIPVSYLMEICTSTYACH